MPDVEFSWATNVDPGKAKLRCHHLTFEDPLPIPFKPTNLQTGRIDLTFPRATFGALPLGTRTWNLTITSPDNKIRKFLAGNFQIVKA